MSFSSADYRYMALALQLAKRGRYTARPNPQVGCVLVKGDTVLAEGWHYRSGEAHAEVHALSQVNEREAKGATAYVTLEPCSHHGRTGACVEALIQAGVGRVVYGMTDPNPLVSGQGVERLLSANILVDGPLLEAQAQAMNQGFVSRMTRQRPWVTAKIATSLDGRTAMASGESRWITGEDSRFDVQRLRAEQCAVLTGIDSIVYDDSRLSLRREELSLDNVDDVMRLPPLRVVLDTHLRISAEASLFQQEGNVLIFTSTQSSWEREQALMDQFPSVTIERVDLIDGKVNLEEVLSCLASRYTCNQVLVETGATLLGSFLQQALVDQLIIYQAPLLLGNEARGLAVLPFQSMAEKLALTITDRRSIGEDMRITATIKQK